MKNFLKNIIPRSIYFDSIYHFIIFIFDFRRFPSRNSKRFCDMIFFEKISQSDLFLKSFLTDKQYFKIFVRGNFKSELVPKTYFTARIDKKLRDINFPSRCCIKPTHTSGQVIIRESGETLDFQKILEWYDDRLYHRTREPNYRHLQPKCIVEELVFDNSTPLDYKFFVFQGNVKLIQVDVDRFQDHRRDFYDASWEKLDLRLKYRNSNGPIDRPKKLGSMLDVACEFGEMFRFVRVDFYISDDGEFQIGECTFFPDNGRVDFTGKDSELLHWSI